MPHSATSTADRSDAKPAGKPADPKPLPRWKVLLHNDDVNEITFVVESILKLMPLGVGEARQRTLEAHRTGVALLLTTHRERAELYREQFASCSLTVTIEPEEEDG